MTPHDVPFDACWYAPGIPLYRSGNGTYHRYQLDSLPPIADEYLDGSFSWLDDWAPDHPKLSAACRDEHTIKFSADFKRIEQDAGETGLSLPAEFTTFMKSVRLRRALPSVTGCFIRLPDRIVPSPGDNDRFFIMFHSDSQDCLFWYLYLDRRTSDHCVVVSPEYFGVDVDGEEEPDNLNNVEFTAPSFTEYIFRVWVEHSSWNQINLALPLNPVQQRYLDHYRPPGDVSVRWRKCELHGRLLEHGHALWTANVWNIIPTGSFRDALWPPDDGRFPLANLYSHCSWMAQRDPDYKVVETAYCSSCRHALIEYLSEHECTKFLSMLRTHSQLEETG